MTAHQLLSVANELPDDQLEEFVQQVSHLAAKRRCPSLSARQVELLDEINKTPDADRIKRYQVLRAKLQACDLHEPETSELLELSDWLEQVHAERLAAVAELAELWNMSLENAMKQLGVGHLITPKINPPTPPRRVIERKVPCRLLRERHLHSNHLILRSIHLVSEYSWHGSLPALKYC